MLSTPKAKGGLFLASCLCDGLEDNDLRQVTTLLNKDADPNILIPTHGVTPFHLVIGNDSIGFAEEVTKLFLRHGGDPNVKSYDGMTPVHVAAAWGRINILRLLLANGGDALDLDNNGRSPFHYAFDGKYFNAVTLLAKYCENKDEDEDDKPKYNMILDKVLVTNGDLVAEYIGSKNALDLVNITSRNDKFLDSYDYKSNSSSLIVESNSIFEQDAKIEPQVLDTHVKCEENVDAELFDSSFMINNIQRNHLSQSDDKNMLNSSYIDYDFDFANLHLYDVIQRERCLVNKVINHLSTTLGSDCFVNETLHNYKRNRREKNSITSNSDPSFQQEKNANASQKYKYHKNGKSFSSTLNSKDNKDIMKFGTPKMKKQYQTCYTHSTSSKKHRETPHRISLTPNCIFDNSIISMSPNCKTPNRRNRKNTIKTPISSHIHNNSIVSKSPNFMTPICSNRKVNLSRSSSDDNHFSSKLFRKTHKHKNEVQYSDFNRCRKYIAQSTPRRKKRSIYKFRSSRKECFDTYREQRKDNVATNTFITHKILRPVNLNKTIFIDTAEDTTDTVESNLKVYSSKSERIANAKEQDYYRDRFKIKLDEEKYYKDDKTHDKDNSNLMDLSGNNLNRIENESVDDFYSDRKYDTNNENNVKKNPFVTVRKDIFKIGKETVNSSPRNNLKFIYTTGSSSLHSDNSVDSIDCDTKKLLNKDLNVNVNKTCNLHEKNWSSDRFHESLLCKLALEDNSHISQCGKQIYLPESRRSCWSYFSRMDESNVDFARTENTSETGNLDVYKSEKSSSGLSYVSTRQEYIYEDLEEGIVLLERRLCITPLNTFSSSECETKSKMNQSNASVASATQSLPRELFFIDDATLRRELTQFGERPGPITSTTRRVYLKRLMNLKNTACTNIPPVSVSKNYIPKNYTEQNKKIKSHLEFGDWVNHLNTYKSLEKHVFQEFVSPNPSRRWREGTSKASFTYLLLDPRVTQDLPNRSAGLAESEAWSIFLNAIFYIGKGKRSRPFAHLYDAFNIWISKFANSECKKISCILDIWNNDHGVICLHVFQNIIPVEAYTREAAMIDALGTECLGNCKGGEYYGIAATWSLQQKQKFGRYLLYKALQIFLNEGERQVFPQNL